MTLVIRQLDEESRPRWEAYVASSPQATFFHRAGWQRVIERSFGHDTYFLYGERDGGICGVLPLAHFRSRLFGNALISNGCCMGGGPVADDDEVYRGLDSRAIELMRELGADYIEYRRPAVRHADWACRDDLYASFERPIAPAAEDTLKQIPRKQRAVVRKAIESALTDQIDAHADNLYPLYALSVRNLGTPVFAKAYFTNLISEFGADCDVLTVCHQGRPVSSVLNFYFRDRVMPYYTGSGAGARELGAADFMYWRLMRRAAERGYGIFDFGRSKVGTGPYAFKKNWGFTPRPTAHEYKMANGRSLPDINPLNPKYRLFIAAWRRLPLPVANLIGPHIVRNIG
jgi:FemAB-related protein (PEP-CTERM system-associated)